MASEEKKIKSSSLLVQLWNQLSSMKFAIVVLIILAVVSVLSLFLGELYPVESGTPGWQEFWRQQLDWNDTLYNLLIFLELHDPFRSWWYQILLLTLSLSLFTCIVEKFPPAVKSMKIDSMRDARKIEQMRIKAKFKTTRSVEDILASLPRFFRFRREQVGDEWRLSGTRGTLGYLGPILSHAGMLFLAAGGLFVSWAGFTTTVGGYSGDTLSDPGFDFEVRVDSFNIEYYPLGLGQYVLVDDMFIGKIIGREDDENYLLETMSPKNEMITLTRHESQLRNQYDIEMDRGNIKDYVTTATVIEDNQEVAQFRIEVNTPLRYKGYRFYQTSFDTENPQVAAYIDSAEVVISHLSHNDIIDTVYIAPGIPYQLPDGSHVELAQFLPDFRIDDSGPKSASAELRNPAVLYNVMRESDELYHQWSFLQNPFVHAPEDAAYQFQTADIFGFQATGSYMTILVVRKSPGSWAIWLGFLFATVGLMLAFYQTPRRLWLVIKDTSNGEREVIIGGMSTKNSILFQQKFDHWLKRLSGDSSR